jgi:hypothetical protein
MLDFVHRKEGLIEVLLFYQWMVILLQFLLSLHANVYGGSPCFVKDQVDVVGIMITFMRTPSSHIATISFYVNSRPCLCYYF